MSNSSTDINGCIGSSTALSLMSSNGCHMVPECGSNASPLCGGDGDAIYMVGGSLPTEPKLQANIHQMVHQTRVSDKQQHVKH